MTQRVMTVRTVDEFRAAAKMSETEEIQIIFSVGEGDTRAALKFLLDELAKYMIDTRRSVFEAGHAIIHAIELMGKEKPSKELVGLVS